MRDVLKWELGLRLPQDIDITKLGVKSIDLSKNNLGDVFADKLSFALKSDEYMRCVNLQKNKIGLAGFKSLAQACVGHPGLLSVNLKNNPGSYLDSAQKFIKIMKNAFV